MVNLIPVIARADSLTLDELTKAKTTLADDLDANEVPCYGNVIPAAIPSDPESLKVIEVFAQLAEKMPFALIASTEVRSFLLPSFELVAAWISSSFRFLSTQTDSFCSGEDRFWAGVLVGKC